ncbi:hypothetical protein HMPREF0731_2141, partial [Pseudoroseomonas cervicalis ATCC 49957]
RWRAPASTRGCTASWPRSGRAPRRWPAPSPSAASPWPSSRSSTSPRRTCARRITRR